MENFREMIEKRAYHLFLKRGGLHGYHMADWIQAEKEIAAELAAKKKTEQKQPVITKVAQKTDVATPAAPIAAPATQAKAAMPIKPAYKTTKKTK